MFRLKKLRTKSAIRALDDDAEGNKDYIFLPSERVKIIVCYIIHVRALYFLFFDALRPLLESGMLSFFDRQEIYRNSAVKAPCFSCVEETAQAS